MKRIHQKCIILITFISLQTVIAQFHNIELHSTISQVQPMTGIVLWSDNTAHNNTKAIQLEFSYVLYKDIVKQEGVYHWTVLEELLNHIAQRKHQAILRFRYVYVGKQTAVPDYIKNLTDYKETKGVSEGQETWFPDWSHPELQRFHLEFYQKFAEKYDHDPRLAFVQTGFGLWAEYHIYDGPFILGKTFPNKEFQESNFHNMKVHFKLTPWNISIDAADDKYSPFSAKPELKNLAFGLFDDSFMCENHADYNAKCWEFFVRDRYKKSPAGGEFSYYTPYDQEHVLDPQGIHGRSYETLATQFHISYMIGNDQPRYQTMKRIEEGGMANGYKFAIISFKASQDSSIVQVKNKGIAPIYYDAYVTIDGIRSKESLRYLLPNETRTYGISKGGSKPVLTIECDRLVPGQKIEYHADLSGNTITHNPLIKKIGHNWLPQPEDLVIYSPQGKRISRIKDFKKGFTHQSNLSPGIYFITIHNQRNTFPVSKLILNP